MLGITKKCLGQSQRRTVEIIETLGFGVLQGLSIQAGQPCFEPAPRIVQSVKLDSDAESKSECANPESALKKQFQVLFRHLSELREGTVDIEVRHGLPFRLVLERPFTELAKHPDQQS
jgi:hypothetical protein